MFVNKDFNIVRKLVSILTVIQRTSLIQGESEHTYQMNSE